MSEGDDKSESSWEIREIAPAAMFVAGLIWVLALILPSDASTRLSNAGQAVGFVAGAVAVYALVVALRQLDLQRLSIAEQVKEQAVALAQKHDDDERAHMDKLAEAYTTWFEIAFQLISGCDGISTAWTRGGASEARQALGVVYARERPLRLAASRLLMLERRTAFRDRVAKTFASFPSWVGPVPEEQLPQFKEHVELVSALVAERRDAIENLFMDAAAAFGNTGSVPTTIPTIE